MSLTIKGIEYPDDLVDAARELDDLTSAYLSCLMENGTPGAKHADLLGSYYATLPQRLKRVMAHQIAARKSQ